MQTYLLTYLTQAMNGMGKQFKGCMQEKLKTIKKQQIDKNKQ